MSSTSIHLVACSTFSVFFSTCLLSWLLLAAGSLALARFVCLPGWLTGLLACLLACLLAGLLARLACWLSFALGRDLSCEAASSERELQMRAMPPRSRPLNKGIKASPSCAFQGSARPLACRSLNERRHGLEPRHAHSQISGAGRAARFDERNTDC